MTWFRSRKESKAGNGNSPAPGARWPRLRRWLRRAGLSLAALLLYGVLVSVAGYCRAPAVDLAPRPDSGVRVAEVTGLYPVTMDRVVRPRTVEEIARAVAAASGPVSIGGGRFSMGGQTATPDGLQLDLRDFHGIVALDTAARTVTVHSGTRWRELQQAIDPAGLAVKIMQTYNTFTVGGALSVNAHGRYIGQGPLVRSVRAITLVLADGRIVRATPRERSDLFYGAIGGYGALGVIGDVTLDLVPNSHVQRFDTTLALADYPAYFRTRIRSDSAVTFHNADLYPPAYTTVHAVSYARTDLPVTVPDRLQPADQASWSHRLAYKVITSGRLGKWLRQHILDPLMFRGHPVTWRNYEASYDVSELEPASRTSSTYVLQEYFVPVDSLPSFVPRMRAILQAHRVNAVNVSIRHALSDPGTDLAWAPPPSEVFAYVLYYKQGTDPAARREVERWTRELIEATIRSGGRYYLPYQPVATRDQFARAYPRATALFAAKRRVDPTNKFTNTLWDLYEPAPDATVPDVTADRLPAVLPAEARIALDSVPGYARPEGAEYLTHPEWDLVYSSEAYARWLRDGRPPSHFPYVKSVGTFWRSYLTTWHASRTPAGIGKHVMLVVIGLSTAVEYGVKGLYEATLGRLFELAEPAGGTAEDRYAAQVAEDYARLINQKGWYEFSFGHALRHLWTDVPLFGPGVLRKWERRAALSVEYAVKAVYASVIGLGTGTVYSPDELERGIVVAGWDDSLATAAAPLRRVAWLDRRYALLTVPRYASFRDGLLWMARRPTLRVAEACGNHVVTVTGTAPRGWRPPGRSRVVAAYAAPAETERVRVLLAVEARDVLSVLAAAQSEPGLRVDHIYDY